MKPVLKTNKFNNCDKKFHTSFYLESELEQFKDADKLNSLLENLEFERKKNQELKKELLKTADLLERQVIICFFLSSQNVFSALVLAAIWLGHHSRLKDGDTIVLDFK